MPDDTELLIEFCKQSWADAKQSEDQRATLTNIILTVASAVIALIVQKGLTKDTIPLSIFLIVLGIYGGIASEKLYERHQMHIERGRAYRDEICELRPNAPIQTARNQADIKHKSKFPKLSKIRLHYLWLTLHVLITLTGLILCVMIIAR